MGHGQYSQDIAHDNRSAKTTWAPRDAVHPSLDPKGGPREVNNDVPIVVALDVTRSRGDDTKRLYEQLPQLMDALEKRAVVAGVGISIAAIGDATSDKAPLQVGQFEADNRIDHVLKKLWIEEGGGGTGQESYELAAHYYSQTDCVQLREGSGSKGFFFFIGDEGFYPVVSARHRQDLLGEPAEELSSMDVFAALRQKFHTFLLFPAASMEDRKSDIDAEIRKRVLAAGGQVDEVDVRVSLIWDDRNDLDLYVKSPSGEVISFNRKRSSCGGVLDVDRNVRGETDAPVENIRWTKGTAPIGTFTVWVENYAFHEETRKAVPFRIEIEVDGDLDYFEGVASPDGKSTKASSRVEAGTFDFRPAPAGDEETYDAYSDEVVLGQWKQVLKDGHILRLKDAKNITHTLLGALALATGAEDTKKLEQSLQKDGLEPEAIRDVLQALSGVQPV